MKNQTYTPGPWYAQHNQISSLTSSHGCTITNCNATSRGISDVEVEANARLISAAPEMLAALQACTLANWNRLDDISNAIKLARAAIAKATA